MPTSNSFGPVIKNQGFINLWINQILVQLSYNALNFALIIWVFRLTQSTTAISTMLIAVYLPAVILGLFAGVLVDVTNRRTIIRVIDILLSLCFFSLIIFKESYPAIIVIAFLINALAQFYVPAESSAIPIVVKKKQLLTANSLFSITLFSTFLLGFGLAGPLINNFGIDYVFGLGGALLTAAFLLTYKFPSITSKPHEQGKRLTKALKSLNISEIKQVGVSEVGQTLKLIHGNLPILVSLMILAIVQVVIGILGVLIPAFFEHSIQVNAADASYVLILPLGLGMVIGGIILGKIGQKFPKRRLVGAGILAAGLMFFIVGMAPLISPVIKHFPKPRPLPFYHRPPLASILAVGSFLLGMAMVSIVVPSQTVLQESTSDQIRGKVFSVLGVLMAALTLVPVLLVGFLADAFGTMPIFIAMGGSIAILGFLALKPDFYFEQHHLPYRVREFLGLGHWEKK